MPLSASGLAGGEQFSGDAASGADVSGGVEPEPAVPSAIFRFQAGWGRAGPAEARAVLRVRRGDGMPYPLAVVGRTRKHRLHFRWRIGSISPVARKACPEQDFSGGLVTTGESAESWPPSVAKRTGSGDRSGSKRPAETGWRDSCLSPATKAPVSRGFCRSRCHRMLAGQPSRATVRDRTALDPRRAPPTGEAAEASHSQGQAGHPDGRRVFLAERGGGLWRTGEDMTNPPVASLAPRPALGRCGSSGRPRFGSALTAAPHGPGAHRDPGPAG